MNNANLNDSFLNMNDANSIRVSSVTAGITAYNKYKENAGNKQSQGIGTSPPNNKP
jgi:hypothetical protein